MDHPPAPKDLPSPYIFDMEAQTFDFDTVSHETPLLASYDNMPSFESPISGDEKSFLHAASLPGPVKQEEAPTDRNPETNRVDQILLIPTIFHIIYMPVVFIVSLALPLETDLKATCFLVQASIPVALMGCVVSFAWVASPKVRRRFLLTFISRAVFLICLAVGIVIRRLNQPSFSKWRY
ncbi:hypothetical protein IWZ00DRAFT_484924 [Phyllosticta capitalensis]